MKKLPLGVQTFRDMIKKNYLYLDKTGDIYNFFIDDGKYYFLSRPRRFGKSLLVSTLKEIFSGNKELFKGLQFGNYWFESGSPSWLIKLIPEYNVDVTKLENYKAGESIFSSFDIERMHVVSLLFQTGYLTIKEVIAPPRQKNFYILSYPNTEVKEAFMEYLLGDLSSQFADEIAVMVEQLKNALEAGDSDDFFKVVRSIFAGLHYDMFVRDREGYYQTVIYLTLKLIGIGVQAEVETNQGRIDAVVETNNFIYVMEFKLGTADEALAQVKEKKYYEKYLASAKTVKLVGVGFDVEQRNIGDYKIEALSR